MTQISKQALIVENNQSFPNNNNGSITPSDLRAFNVDVIDSTVNQIEYTADSASWNQQIDALEVFTSSQQPSFTALNSFTASQLSVNSGVNTFTQSATGRLNNLESTTSSLNAWSSSINQIIVNGASIGTSTRFFFNGFVSASIIPNVDGAIASITVLTDTSNTPSASFNAYTASTNAFTASAKVSIDSLNQLTASQNSFNLSATASISQLLSFSSSLDAGFVSEAEFAQYTQSVNLYTASTNARLSSIESITGSFATTGSNTFVGNQNITGNAVITGSLLVSGSQVNDVTVIGNIFVTGSVGGNRTTISSGSVRIDSGSGITIMTAGNAVYSNLGGTQFQEIVLENAEGTIQLSIDGTGSYIGDYDPNTGYSKAIKFQPYSDYGSGQVQILRPLQVTGSVSISSSAAVDLTVVGGAVISGSATISGSLTLTGSVYSNVVSASIVSSTASIDLSKGNFFTLTLPASANTHINVQNVSAGQSAMLEITTAGAAATASFSTNVFQPSASFYVPTNAAGTDILTFSSFASNKVYLASVKTMTNA
jgi:hypothetical protein